MITEPDHLGDEYVSYEAYAAVVAGKDRQISRLLAVELELQAKIDSLEEERKWYQD